jgi:hypothetical protein
VVDDFTRACLAIDVDTSIGHRRRPPRSSTDRVFQSVVLGLPNPLSVARSTATGNCAQYGEGGTDEEKTDRLRNLFDVRLD